MSLDQGLAVPSDGVQDVNSYAQVSKVIGSFCRSEQREHSASHGYELPPCRIARELDKAHLLLKEMRMLLALAGA